MLDICGPKGEPPDLVRWDDSSQEAILYPGSDATIEHFDHRVEWRPEQAGHNAGG